MPPSRIVAGERELKRDWGKGACDSPEVIRDTRMCLWSGSRTRSVHSQLSSRRLTGSLEGSPETAPRTAWITPRILSPTRKSSLDDGMVGLPWGGLGSGR